MKIGDYGTSALSNGIRKFKNDIIFKFLGDIDELNCNLAMVKALYSEIIETQESNSISETDSDKYWFGLKDYIHDIQNEIMDISTFIATPPYDSTNKIKNMEEHLEKWEEKVGFDKINTLENFIEHLENILPKVTKIVVPSGNKLIAQIHICWAIARRCERTFVELYSPEGSYGEYIGVYQIIDTNINNIGTYLNRLSDYFFILSRFIETMLNKYLI